MRIRKAEKNAVTAVSAVTQDKKLFRGKGLAGDVGGDNRVMVGDVEYWPPSPDNSLDNKAGDESDGGDDDLPLLSNIDGPDTVYEGTV